MKSCLLFVLFLVALTQAICAPAQSFQPPCKTAEEFAGLPRNASILTVQVKVEKGVLRVDSDPAHTILKLSPRFSCTPKALSEASARGILISDLNGIFLEMSQFYIYGLKNSAPKLNDCGNAMGQVTANWQKYLEEYISSCKKDAGGIGQAFSKYTNAMVGNHLGELGALTLAQASPGHPLVNPDSLNGKITFTVADPIAAWVDPLNPSSANNQDKIVIRSDPDKPAPQAAQDKQIHELVQVLNPLQGHLWRAAEILDLLEDYYFPQGFTQPDVSLTLPNRTVTVRESVRISRIVICPATIKQVTAEIVLYNLLLTEDFKQFLSDGEKLPQVSIPDPCLAFSYPAGRRPLLNYNVFQVQQSALSALKFDSSVTPSDSNGLASLVVRQASATAKATSGAAGTPPKSATPAGLVGQSPAAVPARSNPTASLPTSAPVKGTAITDNSASEANSPIAPPKQLNNFVGGGVDYRPGQGVRPFALYSRQALEFLSPQDSLTAQLGANGKALGGLSYSSDYVLFGTLHHKLSLNVTGSSDFQEKRFLFGGLTDERRTGALLHASYELFHNLDQMQLQISLEGRQTRVELAPSGQASQSSNLSTLDLAASFILDRMSGRFGRNLELNPNVRLGLALTSAEPSYQTGRITATFQQNLPKLYQLHFNGKAQTASGGTPVFELPSFGGEDSVRGFRQDDGLGRRIVSLQSELWNPIPGVSNTSGKIGQFLHRNVWVACFFDAGGIFQAVDAVTGAREGAGLGARVSYKLVILKLDWAYGLGTGRTGDGRGRVYFSITNWLPL